MYNKMELRSSLAIMAQWPTWNLGSFPACHQPRTILQASLSSPKAFWLEGTVSPSGYQAEPHAVTAAIFKAASDQNEPVDPEGYGNLF